MKDPFGSMQGLMSQFGSFRQNPMQMLVQKKMNIPQSMQGNPKQIIQHMMDTGQISQSDYNNALNLSKQIQNNPMFQQMLGRR